MVAKTTSSVNTKISINNIVRLPDSQKPYPSYLLCTENGLIIVDIDKNGNVSNYFLPQTKNESIKYAQKYN